MSGFFKSLGKAVNNIGSDLGREVGYVTRDVSRGIDSISSSPELELLQTGNVVQLVSRSSGRCLQIVTSSAGHLVADGQGIEGPTVYNAHWTIINEGHNIIRIHNNHNYIAIVNGAIVVGHFPPPQAPGPETRFRVSLRATFIVLQSTTEASRHLGVVAGGQLKSALGGENDAQFGVRLIYSPQAQVVHVVGAQGTTPAKK